MQIVLLGTGSPLPDPERAGPATLVRAAGRDLLFDAGRGVLMRMAAAGAAPGALTGLFLTHLHSDHLTDLNDVITSRWVMTMGPTPLPIIGPEGTARIVDRTLAMLEDDIGYRLAHHEDLTWGPECEVSEVRDGTLLDDGTVFDDGTVRVVAAPTDHAPVRPTVGFRVEAEGKAVAIAGDTVPCEGLDRLCAGADAYVQTTIRRSLIEPIPLPRLQDILDYHSSIEDAAATATRAGVRTLVLTHLVPAPAPGTEGEWEAEARAGFDGDVVGGGEPKTAEV
jgi:ribonuclease Z